MSDWIKVSDREPNEEQVVLVVRNNSSVEVARAFRVAGKIEFRDYCNHSNFRLAGVTHWKEFPTFP